MRANIAVVNEPLPEPRFLGIRLRWRREFDWLLAAVVWVITTFGLFARDRAHHLQPASWSGFAIAALASWPLVFRRRWPRAVLACELVAVVLNGLVSGSLEVTTLPVAIALISFAVRRPFRESLVAAIAAFAALLVEQWLRGSHVSLAGIASRLLTVAAVTAIGLFVGSRRAYSEQLRERARGVERERELLAERAVDEERVRIARELHDAIAHHVSLLVVQAGAIRESLPPGSETRKVADSMAATGRQALDEMRNMLGVLRTSKQGDGSERAPQPGIADLQRLVEQTRLARLDTELRIEGVERPLPVGIDLSAYRIVQESLTNVIKHAGAARASVLVRFLPEALELQVTDDGRGDGNRAAAPRPGHGIVGMRERIALYGGDLEAGPAPGGGWRVRAVLPLAAER